MHLVADMLAMLLAVAMGVCVAFGILLWQRRPAAEALPAAPPVVPLPTPPTPVLPPPPPPQAAPGKLPVALDEPETEEDAIEDGRPVTPTPITLVWIQAGRPPERYRVEVDTVSRDNLVFGGVAKRLDVIQIVPSRRLFHTMLLPQERLLAAHDDQDRPIEDIRAWLTALD